MDCPRTIKEPSENPQKEADASSSTADAADPVPYREVQELFHQLCPSLPRLRETPEHRKKAIRSRWKAANGMAVERFTELFTLAESSDFLTGRSGQWSGCSFDWLLSPANAQKVLEGNYHNDRQKKGAKPNGTHQKSTSGGDRNAGTLNEGRASQYGGGIIRSNRS